MVPKKYHKISGFGNSGLPKIWKNQQFEKKKHLEFCTKIIKNLKF